MVSRELENRLVWEKHLHLMPEVLWAGVNDRRLDNGRSKIAPCSFTLSPRLTEVICTVASCCWTFIYDLNLGSCKTKETLVCTAHDLYYSSLWDYRVNIKCSYWPRLDFSHELLLSDVPFGLVLNSFTWAFLFVETNLECLADLSFLTSDTHSLHLSLFPLQRWIRSEFSL